MEILGSRPHRARLIFLVTIGLTGCGSKDPDALATVRASGTVTYLGKPVTKGILRVVPDRGRPAGGAIVDGRFTLGTYEDGDGAIPGTHKVEVIVTEEVPATKKGGEPQLKYLVPERYASIDSSKLSLTIPAEGSTELKLDFP